MVAYGFAHMSAAFKHEREPHICIMITGTNNFVYQHHHHDQRACQLSILTQGINMRQLGRKTMQRSNGTFVEVGSVEDIFKVCCCLDVMVQEDKGTYCGGEPDWRQLDDAELQ